jgi:4-hydroxy-3-methylbut-2-enyl diphosphate reductase IspH
MLRTAFRIFRITRFGRNQTMCNEKAKKMRYVLKIGQLTTTYDNFDDFVEALREEAEDREFNRHIDLCVKVTNLL